MSRLTTDEQLEQIWNAAIEAGIAPIRTVDRSNDPFAIFDGWEGVEAIAELVNANFAELAEEHAPTWAHLPRDRQPDPRHHIEWAIGEFGFSDQFSTCSHCYAAIDTNSIYADHHQNSVTGEIACGDCLRSHPDFADDYLSDMASQMTDDAHYVYVNVANPSAAAHNFVCINGESSKYWGDDNSDLYLTDHPDYDSRLTYASREAMQRLGIAAQRVDPHLQIVYASMGGSNRIWARFNPNENMEYSAVNERTSINDEIWGYSDEDTGFAVLGYAIGRVIAKWVQLQEKRGWK